MRNIRAHALGGEIIKEVEKYERKGIVEDEVQLWGHARCDRVALCNMSGVMSQVPKATPLQRTTTESAGPWGECRDGR